MKKLIAGILCLVFVLFAVFTCFYTVKETEQAVVTTFGKVTSVQGAGLHFKIPFGVQRVKKVPSNVTQKMTIGYGYDDDGSMITYDNESKMITGDYNIVDIDFFVEWKISDPVAYLYNSNQPKAILKSVVQSSARNVIGSKNVDDVLTTGKEQIQNEIEERIRKNMESYNIGIYLSDVKIQDSQPPTNQVIEAFKAVESAKQQKFTLVNNAQAYQNKQIPEAQSQADKITKDAEAYKESRIQEAEGQVARFNEMYSEYANNKAITKTRMYLEVIEDIYPDVDIYVNSSSNSVNTMLPLESFSGINTNGGAK